MNQIVYGDSVGLNLVSSYRVIEIKRIWFPIGPIRPLPRPLGGGITW